MQGKQHTTAGPLPTWQASAAPVGRVDDGGCFPSALARPSEPGLRPVSILLRGDCRVHEAASAHSPGAGYGVEGVQGDRALRGAASCLPMRIPSPPLALAAPSSGYEIDTASFLPAAEGVASRLHILKLSLGDAGESLGSQPGPATMRTAQVAWGGDAGGRQVPLDKSLPSRACIFPFCARKHGTRCDSGH